MHVANLMVFGLVMTFGMFDMDVRHARVTALYSIGEAASAMLWGWHHDPLNYLAELEIVYFVLAVTMLGSISPLSVVLARMRGRLRRQKDELCRRWPTRTWLPATS